MRSFFHDVVEDVSYKKITISCKMHDFVQFLDKNECSIMEANARTEIGSEKVRHLTLMFTPDDTLSYLISFGNCKNLRTLRAFDSRITTIDSKAISQLKCLRTLNLSSNDVKELPEEINELTHLRYLDLSDRLSIFGKTTLQFVQFIQFVNLAPWLLQQSSKPAEDVGNLINSWAEVLPKGIYPEKIS